jgi:hypothetical protein
VEGGWSSVLGLCPTFAIAPRERAPRTTTVLAAFMNARSGALYLVDLSELKKSRCARSEGIGKSYASRILRLALLAPDIVEAATACAVERAAARGSDHAGKDDAAKVWTPRPSAPAGVRPSVGGDER